MPVTISVAAPATLSLNATSIPYLPQIVAGDTLTFQATATDNNPSAHYTFSLDPGRPAGATITTATNEDGSTVGNFSWAPTSAQSPDSYTITVRVTDDQHPAQTATQTFTVNVESPHAVPLSLNVGAVTPMSDGMAQVNTQLQFQATASILDGSSGALTYSLGPDAPQGAAIDPQTGSFSWTPTAAGIYTFTVAAADLRLRRSQALSVKP